MRFSFGNVLLLVKNKVILYAVSRYFISGLSFITSLIMAGRLGSFYLGVWGFIMLIRHYFQIINLGIPDSTTVLLVNNRDDKPLSQDYEKNSFLWIVLLSAVIIIFAILHYFFQFGFITKYGLTWEFYVVCIFSCLTLFNDLCMKIARVKGRVFELIFYQSIIQILSFVIVVCCTEDSIIPFLVMAYLIGNILSVYVFLRKRDISFSGKVRLDLAREIIEKGFYIFLYNFLSYLIMISTRTVISQSYDISEFGLFTFAYTLANSIVLIVDAVAALIIPKLLSKYKTDDINSIQCTINQIRVNYIYVSYFLLFILLILFTLLLIVLPDYNNSFDIVVYTSLAVAIQSHSFPYMMLLLTKNKEKVLALSSGISLVVNLVLVIVMERLFDAGFQYLVIATWISYAIHGFLCMFFAYKTINLKRSVISLVCEFFPLSVIMPVLFSFIIGFADLRWWIGLPLLLFVFMNLKFFKQLMLSIKQLVFNPEIVDIK